MDEPESLKRNKDLQVILKLKETNFTNSESVKQFLNYILRE